MSSPLPVVAGNAGRELGRGEIESTPDTSSSKHQEVLGRRMGKEMATRK